MTLLTILSIHISLMLVGYLSAMAIGVKNKLEGIALSYLLGSGFVTILFLLNHWIFGFELKTENFILTLLMLGGVTLPILYARKALSGVTDFKIQKSIRFIKKLPTFEKGLIFSLALLGVYTLLENFLWPVTAWDSLALYDFRAKVIAATGNMVEGIQLGYFFQYPPYTSFLHLFAYLFDNERVQVAYSFIYISFLLSFYLLLKRKQPTWVALLGTLFLAIDGYIFQHATIGYSNLAYVVFLCLGFIYLLHWFQQGLRKDLIVGAILVALSTWVRSAEPFWWLAIALILIKFFKDRKDFREGLFVIVFIVAVSRFWNSFVNHLYTLNNFYPVARRSFLQIILSTPLSFETLLSRIQEVLAYFYHFSSNVFRYLLVPFGFATYYDWKAKHKLSISLQAVLLLSISLLISGIYVLSLYYETWNQIPDSLQRVSMIFPPLLIFVIFNSRIWKQHATGNT